MNVDCFVQRDVKVVDSRANIANLGDRFGDIPEVPWTNQVQIPKRFLGLFGTRIPLVRSQPKFRHCSTSVVRKVLDFERPLIYFSRPSLLIIVLGNWS